MLDTSLLSFLHRFVSRILSFEDTVNLSPTKCLQFDHVFPLGKEFLKTVKEGDMKVVISLSPFSHYVFYPSKENSTILSNNKFVV